MNIEIRYISRSGNTKKIAKTIGKELGVEPLDATIPLPEHTDVLFLGSALYAFQLDIEMTKFIKTLSPHKVSKVYCFSTTAVLPSSYNTLRKALAKQDITAEKFEFHCRGRFGALYADRPNKSDFKKAASFAKNAISLPKSN